MGKDSKRKEKKMKKEEKVAGKEEEEGQRAGDGVIERRVKETG